MTDEKDILTGEYTEDINALGKQIDSLTKERDHFKMTTEFENKACIRAEDKLKKLEAENAELKEKIEDWRAKNLQLELVQKDLQAQLSKSQERVDQWEKDFMENDWRRK